MKINKYFLGLLGLTAVMVASCSDDDDYSWATVSGPQVFFSADLPSQYEISPSATSFNVPISRATDEGALTVNLTSQTANPMYSFPSSVTFEAGQKEATIPVSYDPAQIEYGRYDTLTVAIADDAQATSWGTQAFTFTAGVTDWGPWEKWNAAGTASFIYVNFWEGEDPGLPFEYRHNMITTNLYQFRLSNWGYGVQIVFDYDEETGRVTCPSQWTGYDHSSYGYVYVTDLANYCVIRGWDIDPTTDYGTFDQEQGIITIPLAYYVDAGSFGYDPEYIYIDGYSRADYSISLDYAGVFTNVAGQPFAVCNATLGADATDIRALIVSADDDADAVVDAIAAGDVEAEEVTVSNGQFQVAIPDGATGNLQVVAVVMADGEVKAAAATNFEYYGGGASPWKTIGTGLLTDNFFITVYSPDGTNAFDPETFEVEIQTSSDNPGIIRLVNPFEYYSEAFDSYTPANFDINAADPDGVYFGLQQTGIDDGNGMTSLMSWGGYMLGSYSFDQLKEAAYLGTLKDGVITLPKFHNNDYNIDYQGLFAQGSDAYYTGQVGDFKVVLPEAVSSEARAKARAHGQAIKFASRMNLRPFTPKSKVMKNMPKHTKLQSNKR